MSFVKAMGEYLDLVKRGIQNGDKILEAMRVSALVKNGNISDEALAEILRRKDICTSCPFNSINAKQDRGYVDPAPLKDVEHCTLCLCRLGGDNTKEYCLSCNCGMEYWNKINPDKPQMIPKWTAFEISNEEQKPIQ